MKNTTIQPFKLIGTAVRTTNQNGQAMKDLGQLWSEFKTDHIPNKVNDVVYCIYTDYESDFTRPYTAILGCLVHTLDEIPEGMTGRNFNGGNYLEIPAEATAIGQTWGEIWQMDLDRAYTADLEIYGAETKIMIGIKTT